jgi:general secretion pathway protein G
MTMLGDAACPVSGRALLPIVLVVLVIVLLHARFRDRADRIRMIVASADIKAIEMALDLYKLDVGHYPATWQGLSVLTPGAIGEAVDPAGYLDKVPLDPWGNAYAYVSDGWACLVKSHGPDGPPQNTLSPPASCWRRIAPQRDIVSR